MTASFTISRPIALVGMPGSGKSSTGRILAARLGVPFRDSDELVEQAAGATVAQLFAAEGEAAFRARERAVIAAQAGRGPLVLATGGGAMAETLTRACLLDRFVTIWLDASPGTLAARLAGTDGRPLLGGADRLRSLDRLLRERRTFYAQAALHVGVDRCDPAAASDRIVRALASRARPSPRHPPSARRGETSSS